MHDADRDTEPPPASDLSAILAKMSELQTALERSNEYSFQLMNMLRLTGIAQLATEHRVNELEARVRALELAAE